MNIELRHRRRMRKPARCRDHWLVVPRPGGDVPVIGAAARTIEERLARSRCRRAARGYTGACEPPWPGWKCGDLIPSTNMSVRPLKAAGVRARASAYSGESYQAFASLIEGNSTIEK